MCGGGGANISQPNYANDLLKLKTEMQHDLMKNEMDNMKLDMAFVNRGMSRCSYCQPSNHGGGNGGGGGSVKSANIMELEKELDKLKRIVNRNQEIGCNAIVPNGVNDGMYYNSYGVYKHNI